MTESCTCMKHHAYLAVLQELVDIMHTLSMRPGVTLKEVADLLNPLGDTARALLEGTK